MAKSTGAKVRAAYDGPQIDYDTFIGHHASQARAEESAASKMGEARNERKQFLDDTNLHGKSVSAIRAGLKIKDELKQQDWLRSMKALLPIAEQHITGNTTTDMFPDDEDAADLAEDPMDLDQFSPDEGDEAEDYGDMDDGTDDFNDAVDAVKGNVVKAFGS